MDPEKLIDALRETDIYIEKIYLNGGCYAFHKFLKVIYPNVLPYFTQEEDHVVTRIDGRFYDITGEVKGKFSLLSEQQKYSCEQWSFYKYNFLSKNCPTCGEPV